MKTLIRNVKLIYPVPDDYKFTLENSQEFSKLVDDISEFINSELKRVNSNFMLYAKIEEKNNE